MLQENGGFALYDAKGVEEGRVNLDAKPLVDQARRRIASSEEFNSSWVFMLARDLETNEMFSAREVRVLCETNGRVPASEVIDRCGFSSGVARQVIGSLVRRGWLISREGSKAVEIPAPPASAPKPAPADEEDEGRTNPGVQPPEPLAANSARGRVACFTLDDTNSMAYPLFDDVQTIGRGPENSIVIDDRSVSSSHARLVSTPEGHRLEDLGSSNGTFVNGKRIESVVLHDKDRIRLGKMFMVYMIPDELSDGEVGEEEAS